MNPQLLRWIYQYAPRYGLDPRAVAAISMNESGGRLNAVGDAGSSFGPWQLHVGGALPRGRGAGWAGSLPGVLYALRQMGGVAHGLHGQAAVSAIARRFERPADPQHEIQVALGYYGRPGFARMPGGAGGGGGGLPPGMPPQQQQGPPPQWVPPSFAPINLPQAQSALANLQAIEPATMPGAAQPLNAPLLPSTDSLDALHSRLLHG